ncbi:DUF3179 domain-containing protein [Corallincola holothuriorum]|uniref:DUF3179 domain-containing protein n=1 Tax=Corallincola holothuriorum TaxID=2282215 RepID=A0A368NQA7_9GAMM|nr:DUF3179 domain-containing (seleno)protein [Corallincola holothuriorum]RCU51451.1 DUF3179 domain-containing protein [Corallincola holothuriorum]
MNTAKTQRIWFRIVAFVTAAFSIFSAVLMTEPGQSLDLPREWIVTYYQYRWWFIGLNLAMMGYLWHLHCRYKMWTKFWMTMATSGVLVCIIAANFLLAAFFPSYQHTANYVSVIEADVIINDEDIVYAVEINGDVRGFPRKHLEIPHIAGDNIGGKEVTMTFCALSNLPVVIEQDLGQGESDIGILIQTNNNLVMVDRQSGDLIQQVTMTSEFGKTSPVEHPNTMMTWADFKELYPHGTVFIYGFDRALDDFLLTLFEQPMKNQFSEEHGPIFPTLDMKDERVGFKEQVWGYRGDNKEIAFTLDFVKSQPTYEFEFEGQPMVLVYDEQRSITNLFSRTIDNQTVSVDSLGTIDIHGNTALGRLEQIPMLNGIFWMVWSHWFPNTEVMN